MMELTEPQRNLLVALLRQTEEWGWKSYHEVAASIGQSEAQAEEIVNYLQLAELLDCGSHPLVRLSIKGRQEGRLIEMAEATGYNLTERQRTLFRKLTSAAPPNTSAAFTVHETSQFCGIRFDRGEMLIIDAADLLAFENAQLILLVRHEGRLNRGQILASGFQAVEANFRRPTTSYPTGNVHQTLNVGGNMYGPAIAGNNNLTQQTLTQVKLPDPGDVDIERVLGAIRSELANLNSPHQKKINNALDEACDEASKESPDRDEIGNALHRAVSYAKKSAEFIAIAGPLSHEFAAAISWLGANWQPLLEAVHLVAK